MTAPVRIQRRRTKGWRMPEGAVYVGRPTGWGNPYAVGWRYAIEYPGGRREVYADVRDRAQAVELYRTWLRDQPSMIDAIRDELAGRDLACWCPLNEPCHADVLLHVAAGGKP